MAQREVFSIKLNIEEKNRLEKLAKIYGCSKGELIRRLIEKAFAQET